MKDGYSEPTKFQGGKFTRQQKIIIAGVSLASFMCMLDAYIINISLPVMADFFNVTSSQISRINLAFFLVLAAGIPIWGMLADKMGLKKIFVIGYVLFTFGSLVCGLAAYIHFLIIGRAIQGIGAGMLTAASPAYIVKYFRQEVRGGAFGIFSTSAAFGLIVGAPLGGLLTEYFGWSSVFMINIPIGLIAVISALYSMPADGKHAKLMQVISNFDWAGVVLMVAGLVLLVSGFNGGSCYGWTVAPIALLLSGAVVMTMFVIYERKISAPMLAIDMLNNKTYFYGSMANVFTFIVISGVNFILPFQIAVKLGRSTRDAGFIMLAFSLTYAVLSLIMGKLSDIIRPLVLCISGLFIGGAAFALFAFCHAYDSPAATILFLIVLGAGFSAFVAPSNKLVMTAVSKDNAGTASALLRTFITLASLAGVAIFDALINSNTASGNPTFRQAYYVASVFLIAAAVFLVSLFKHSKSTGTE
jgi:EmrB/QacA subfamily drug resistance transporter